MGNRKTGERVQQASEAKSYLIALPIPLHKPSDCPRFQQNNSNKFLDYFFKWEVCSYSFSFLI
jgi:hypothetical protein